MVEPPYKRSRRSENDVDRRRESPDGRNPKDSRDRGARDNHGGRDRFDRDSHRKRESRYRSRSRERERDRDRYEDSGRERGGRRDEGRDRDKDRDRNSDRGGGRDEGMGRDNRDSRGGARGGSVRNIERGDRKRYREEDAPKRDTRSRSPARETSSILESVRSPLHVRAFDNDDAIKSKSRTATPPVAFKVGPGAQGHNAVGLLNGQMQKGAPSDSIGGQGYMTPEYNSDAMDAEPPVAAKSTGKKSKGGSGKQSRAVEKSIEEDDDIIIEEDEAMVAMQSMLGFGGFGTTKQKKIPGNDVYAVRKEKKTEYRQYMNRVGGFNRPLSPSRE